MSMQQVLQSLAERLHYSASVRTVFGDPVETQGRTIIPVARVAYGLGGGSGRKRETDGGPPAESHEPGRGPQTGGGGIAVTPVGVLEVLPEGTRFVTFGGKGKKLAGAFLAGIAVGLLLQRKTKAAPVRGTSAPPGRQGP